MWGLTIEPAISDPDSFLFYLDLVEDLRRGGLHQVHKYFFADVNKKLNSVDVVLLIQGIVKSHGDTLHENISGMRLFRIDEMTDPLKEFSNK